MFFQNTAYDKKNVYRLYIIQVQFKFQLCFFSDVLRVTIIVTLFFYMYDELMKEYYKKYRQKTTKKNKKKKKKSDDRDV